ncbi:MAG: NAD(+)/NADH kinase [Bacteroidales bacterium]|nr:NAD(+)/NADH kinase [Candidatus Cryptobacteroides faecihippi]
MNLGIYTRNDSMLEDARLVSMLGRLRDASFGIKRVHDASDLKEGVDMLLSVGGDGTFLSASKRVGDSGIPVLGINLGRLGFLSEYSPEEACEALLSGRYELEDRGLVRTSVDGKILESGSDFWPYSLNEVCVHRTGAAILGIEVSIDGDPLPAYWADGLLVATSSGSTAYSLSAGGPICSPDAKVLIIAPVAPHNLNVRPLVVPDSAVISISMRSRDDSVQLSMDNRELLLAPSAKLEVGVAQFSLKRVRLGKSNFFKALTTKLFWGEDIRNEEER